MQAIGFLLMGLSGLGLVAGGGLFVYALRTGRTSLARNLGMFALGWAALYLVVLLSASWTSQENVLALKERKAFCGFYLDCHLGVSVEAVQQAAAVGEGAGQVTADGVFYLVTVRVSSDAVRATLPLVNPEAVLHDAGGAVYERARDAEEALAAAVGTPAAFSQHVPAGTSYTKTLVFDVPAGVRAPKLLVTKGASVERFVELFLIGDEDSLFHRKTVFQV